MPATDSNLPGSLIEGGRLLMQPCEESSGRKTAKSNPCQVMAKMNTKFGVYIGLGCGFENRSCERVNIPHSERHPRLTTI